MPSIGLTATEAFGQYADVYDLLYEEKDYDSECDFLEQVFHRWGRRIQRVLDLGCGTGGHALPLAKRGYNVVGIDRSPAMLAIARQKVDVSDHGDRLLLLHGDACHFNAQSRFDAVISMFAVMSYQVSDDALDGMLNSVRRSLVPGGLFVADFWFGPAVLNQCPQARTKVLEGNLRTVRHCVPNWNLAERTVRVCYQVQQFAETSLTNEIQECHALRYFFLPELQQRLSRAGLQTVHACSFPSLHLPPSYDSWNVAIVAQARDEETPS
ncbi:MAG: class I SAM-dependent methyltransferase [Planctomycetes bacterium]|nr:class I SAM-dependent methyltransferase [Planctomycetota bacterium]